MSRENWPDLETRYAEAQRRIKEGICQRQIPAHWGDGDLVLFDYRAALLAAESALATLRAGVEVIVNDMENDRIFSKAAIRLRALLGGGR